MKDRCAVCRRREMRFNEVSFVLGVILLWYGFALKSVWYIYLGAIVISQSIKYIRKNWRE